MRSFSLFLLMLFGLLFSGCESSAGTDPAKLHFDREICERCRMIISDRKHAAQVINPQNAKRYFFDDIGCVELWFKEKEIAWANEAIIYVTDYDTGAWINARTAFWSTEHFTSMSYGLVAHSDRERIDLSDPYRKVIDYAEVKKRILEMGR